MNRGLFITGTDTDVGKTLLTAALFTAARNRDLPAMIMKPLQTGATHLPHGWSAPDADLCLRLAGLHVDPHTYRDVAPCCFSPPCSPHLAAAQVGSPIELPPLVTAFQRLAATFQPVFVEGAGGLLVPINDQHTMLDLIGALALPVVVAARPGLGTINHTLLTLRALGQRGVQVRGVVFVETQPTEWGSIERDNRTTIESRGQVPVLGVIPYIPGIEEAEIAPKELVQAGTVILDALDPHANNGNTR